MPRKRTLPTMTKPFAHVHNTFTTLGFTELPAREGEGTIYELMFRDASTRQQYPYRIYTQTQENGQTVVYLNEAHFQDKEYIPESALAAAEEILGELQQYLENGQGGSKSKPIDEVMNGRMANDESEVVRLGKVMSGLPTNSQVLQNGMIPDPIQ